MIREWPKTRVGQNERRAGVAVVIAALLSSQCAQSLTDGQLYVKSQCQWSYQIKDIYNVTALDLGPVCPEESVRSASGYSLLPSEIYQLRIKPMETGRDVEIGWDFLGCQMEFYIQFAVSFQPDFWVHDTQRKCIRFTVKRLSSVITNVGDQIYTYLSYCIDAFGKRLTKITEPYKSYGTANCKIHTGNIKLAYDIVRLNFNCLRINSKEVGTLSIQKYGATSVKNDCPPEIPADSFKTFDLGCGIDKTEVWIVQCLTIEFRGLHHHTDYKNTRIELYVPGSNCRSTFSGSTIIRFNDPGILVLPVYGNGSYNVKVNLLCNASGEVEEKMTHLHTNVTNAYMCSAYNATSPSTCSHTDTTRTMQSTQTPPFNHTHIIAVVVVVGIGIIGIITALAFIHRERKGTNSGQGIKTSQEDAYPLQDLPRNLENGCRNNARREVTDTTEFT